MRLRFLVICAAALAALVGSPPLAAGATATAPPGQYYLSLGDSLAFGYQRDRLDSELAKGSYSPANFPGYTYRFGSVLQEINPDLQVVDFGCPGETTISYTTGCVAQENGLQLHDGYAGSQESAADEFLIAHAGQVSPITVSLGVNDLFHDCPTLDPTCAINDIPLIAQRLAATLGELRFLAPSAEIIVLEYYNPLYVTNSATDPLAQGLDAAIGQAAAFAGADTVDAFSAINEPKAPFTETRSVCKYTLMCPGGDIHLSNPGYALVARLFDRASGF